MVVVLEAFCLLVVLMYGKESHGQMTFGDTTRAEPQEYCEDEPFKAECGKDEVILIQSALYGRMKVGRCVTQNYGNVGCAVDVMLRLDEWCSGRRKCDISVAALMQGNMKPCPKDFRSYLEASYTCIKVYSAANENCRSNGITKITSQTEGSIASVVTEETGCGGIDSPWHIQVPEGQQINLTLWDFGLLSAESAQSQNEHICQVYAIIKDVEQETQTKTVCGGSKRESIVYTSTGNVIEMRVVNKQNRDEQNYFVVNYKAVGCPDYPSPPGGWAIRTGDIVTVGCNDDDSEWHLTCHKNAWVGNVDNCTSALSGADRSKALWHVFNMSHGVSVVIVIAVAMLVGSVVLLLGIYYLRKRRMARQANRHHYATPDFKGETGQYAAGHLAEGKKYSQDIYLANENNYYRTWQLQNRQAIPPPFPSNTIDGRGGRSIEHVYESPKFERKDYGHHCMRNPEGMRNIQYFELDPEAVEKNPHMMQPSLKQSDTSDTLNSGKVWSDSDISPDDYKIHQPMK